VSDAHFGVTTNEETRLSELHRQQWPLFSLSVNFYFHPGRA